MEITQPPGGANAAPNSSVADLSRASLASFSESMQATMNHQTESRKLSMELDLHTAKEGRMEAMSAKIASLAQRTSQRLAQ